MNIVEHLTPVNHSSGRYGEVVKNIVLHTIVGTIQGAQGRFLDPTQEVSTHYGIATTGEIRRWVRDGDTAWHAGNWAVNKKSIGIEHEDHGNANDAVRTPELYAASAQLVAELCRKYSVPCQLVAVTGHTPNGPGIVLHHQVDEIPGGTACPDGLDVNRIVREAQAIIAQETQTTNIVVNTSVDPNAIHAVNETVTVISPVLHVHKAPNTGDAGNFANTPDGYVHTGDEVHVVGYVRGEDPYHDGRNVWLKTLNALGASHWIWAGGTSFNPKSLPDPAEQIPVHAATIPPTLDALTPPPSPQAPTVPVDATATTKPGGAVVVNLSSGRPVPVAKVKGGVTLPIAGTTGLDGQIYLVTKFMIEKGVDQGINLKYFQPIREPKKSLIRKFLSLHGL